MEKCLSNNKTITLFMSNNFSVFEPETVPTSKENFLLTHCFNGTFPQDSYLIKKIHISNLLEISTHQLQRTWKGSVLPLLIPSVNPFTRAKCTIIF